MNNLLKAIVLAASWLTAQPAFAALNVMACEPEWGALSRELGGDKVSQDREHMAAIGALGGATVSRDREHMARIGRMGAAAARVARGR